MKNEVRFPTVLGLLLTAGGLLLGMWLVQRQIRVAPQAAGDTTPNEVVISDITDTGFAVSWVTAEAATGFVQYGEAAGDPENTVSDDRDQNSGSVAAYLTHMVTIGGLRPATAYRFEIGSAGKLYDFEGVPYQVMTGPVLGEKPAADVAYGQVVIESGEPADGALVYIQMNGGGKQAAMVKPNGSWVIPLSTVRKADLTGYLPYDKEATEIMVEVNAGPWGKSKLTTTTGQDSPVIEIVAGAEIQTDKTESKIGIIKVAEKNELIMLAPRTGEYVNTETPEIIGTAPAGTEITIVINSKNTISASVVAGEDGGFSYSVPTALDPGEHTITISTIIDGVRKQVTRSFIVYAAGESFDPVFSATPSATLAPTIRPTATVLPSPTVKPTAVPTVLPTVTIKPTPTIAPTAKPTITPVPVTPTPGPTAVPTITIKPIPTPTPTTELQSAGVADYTGWLAVWGMILVLAGWKWYKTVV